MHKKREVSEEGKRKKEKTHYYYYGKDEYLSGNRSGAKRRYFETKH